MTTNLSTKGIVKLLKKETKEGQPSIMGSPFIVLLIFSGQFDRYFFGEIEEDSCRLSLNRVFIGIPFIISAHFQSNETNTEVKFNIERINFGYWWLRLFPLVIVEENLLSVFLVLLLLPLLLYFHMKIKRTQVLIVPKCFSLLFYSLVSCLFLINTRLLTKNK